jgi:hypothetical protein
VVRDLGYERATDLNGGFAAWKAAGLPVRNLEERSIDPQARPGLGPPEPAEHEKVAWHAVVDDIDARARQQVE